MTDIIGKSSHSIPLFGEAIVIKYINSAQTQRACIDSKVHNYYDERLTVYKRRKDEEEKIPIHCIDGKNQLQVIRENIY